jgi:hypothetical protein
MNTIACALNELYEEVKQNRKTILEQEKRNGIDWTKRSDKNHNGASFALYMQTKCANALRFVTDGIKRQGFIVDSLVHDGCHVRKANERELNIEELNDHVQKKYKHVKVKVKPFERTTDIDNFKDLPICRHEFNNRVLKKQPLSVDEIITDTHPNFENLHDKTQWITNLVARMNTKVAFLSSTGEFIVKKDADSYDIHKKTTAKDVFANYFYFVKDKRGYGLGSLLLKRGCKAENVSSTPRRFAIRIH